MDVFIMACSRRINVNHQRKNYHGNSTSPFFDEIINTIHSFRNPI